MNLRCRGPGSQATLTGMAFAAMLTGAVLNTAIHVCRATDRYDNPC